MDHRLSYRTCALQVAEAVTAKALVKEAAKKQNGERSVHPADSGWSLHCLVCGNAFFLPKSPLHLFQPGEVLNV
jgi:hypothetical protein